MRRVNLLQVKSSERLIEELRFDHIYVDLRLAHRDFILHYGDMTDSSSLIHIAVWSAPPFITKWTALVTYLFVTRTHSRYLPKKKSLQGLGGCRA